MKNGSTIRIETDDLGYTEIPMFANAVVGYTHLKQATVYDVNVCRRILSELHDFDTSEDLENSLYEVIKTVERSSGITPVFIEESRI